MIQIHNTLPDATFRELSIREGLSIASLDRNIHRAAAAGVQGHGG